MIKAVFKRFFENKPIFLYFRNGIVFKIKSEKIIYINKNGVWYNILYLYFLSMFIQQKMIHF